MSFSGLKLLRKIIPSGIVCPKGCSEPGCFTADDINCLEMHNDNALQDHSVGSKYSVIAEI